jgi:hypothetical protein
MTILESLNDVNSEGVVFPIATQIIGRIQFCICRKKYAMNETVLGKYEVRVDLRQPDHLSKIVFGNKVILYCYGNVIG